jgi:hypothetical protein
MRRAAVAVAGLMLMACAPAAWAMGKGGSMLAIELTNGTADVADKLAGATSGSPNFTAAYITAYTHSELGVQLQYWKMMSEDYAFTISAGWGFFNETDKPGQGAAPGSPDSKFSISSFNVRLGGDRVVKLSERMSLYAGPGIEFWSGNAKFEPDPFGTTGTGEYKNESTVRWGLSGRLGGTMWLSEYVGLTGHVGGRYGYASVEEQGAKATWWPSSLESSVGLLYAFGEK